MIVAFDMPGVSDVLERLSADQIDALPFGVVRLSPTGIVTSFSRTEGVLSGFDPRRALGRGFFDAVAPCMNTPELRGRLEAEAQRGALDLEFGHTGDFADPARFIRVRVCSARGGGHWLLLQR